MKKEKKMIRECMKEIYKNSEISIIHIFMIMLKSKWKIINIFSSKERNFEKESILIVGV